MKRSHFRVSKYDPFVEEDDDFPDNDRRKRSKFGCGSGQWRFTDRTPSPEKEPQADAFEIKNPSRPTTSPGIKAPPSEWEVQSSEKLETGENIENRRLPHYDGTIDHRTSEFSPPSPPSTTVDSSPGQHLPKGDNVVGTPNALTLSEVPQGLDQGLESEFKVDSETENMNSATTTSPTANFGLDGSTLSRLKETSEKLLLPGAVVHKLSEAEAHSDHEDSPEAMMVSHPETSVSEEDGGFGMEPQTVKDSAHDFLFFDDQSPTEPESPGYRVQAPKQLPSDSITVGNGLENEESESESESFEETSQASSDTESEVSPQGVIADEEANAPIGEVSSDRQSLDESIRETASREAELQFSVPEEVKDRGEVLEPSLGLSYPDQHMILEPESMIRDMRAGEAVPSVAKKKAEIEIIDLESDDEEEQSARSSTHPSDLPPTVPLNFVVTEQPDYNFPSPRPATGLVIDELSYSPHGESIGEVEETIFESEITKDQSPLRENTKSSRTPENLSIPMEEQDLIPNALDVDIVQKTGLLQQKDNQDLLTKMEVSGNLRSEEQASRSQSPVTLQPQPGVKDERTSQESLIELPSTVPDSVQQPTMKSQLLTPDITQRTSFTSQASSSSLQTVPDDDTLPTPQLTQGKNDVGAVLIKPSLDQEPFPVPGPDSKQTDDIKLEIRGRGESLPGVKKAPTLIEKLKAMRRLSSQTPQKIGDASAASPWFAPKKSIQVVPDSEAESEVESVSDIDSKPRKINQVARFQTPEKQKSLAKSFIRSPPQREGMTSLTSSPGYLPPSQPPPPGFRTSLSYFVPLATLQSYFSLSVDILAIALSAADVTRASSGPRDYHQTIYLTDPSSENSKTPITITQIFRSYNKCFPIIEKGDALLLREFKVQSFQRQLALLSTQSSAWAVFRKHADVQIRGPPVELGAEERGFARGLWRWWDGLGQEAKEGLDQIVPKANEKRVGSGRSSNGLTKKEGQQRKDFAKKEALEGLGIDLPGSQEKSRKVMLKERGADKDKVIESIEPPKRVLRPRGARGRPEKSESPTKAINRRSGTVFTGGLGEPDSE